jgi:hypothetical protein
VRAAYDGSLAAAKGITWSRNLGEASCTGGEAWEAMIWHGIGEGDGVEVAAWCRVSEGVNGAIYRGGYLLGVWGKDSNRRKLQLDV